MIQLQYIYRNFQKHYNHIFEKYLFTFMILIQFSI